MTVRDLRYVTRARMTGPARDGGRRFERSSPSPPSKDGGLSKVEQLREQVERGTYEVDTEAVAAAILRRLLERPSGNDGRLA